MNKSAKNISIASHENMQMDGIQKISVALGILGLFIMALALFNVAFPSKEIWLTISIIAIFTGVITYANRTYLHQPAGIKNNGVWHKNFTNRGSWAWMTGILLTSFYVVLYWYPQYLGLNEAGGNNTGIVGFFDPLSFVMNGKAATQWFVYGTLYTVAILGLGYKFILKYKNNKYQLVRTISVMFFQLGFAFLIPEILEKLNPEKAYFAKDLKNMWPLNYYFFNDWHLKNMFEGGNLGMFMLIFGVAMIFIISPILTYFYGKRWYCSWVCGCGGLAETAGDSFRHLSSKSTISWKIERWMIHSVLVFSFVMTIAVLFTFLSNNPEMSFITKGQFIWGIVIFLTIFTSVLYIFKRKDLDTDATYTMLSLVAIIIISLLLNYFSGQQNILFIDSNSLREWYGFAIGAAFSGVVGVGFYPILGNRVWCRFGCPMAAILGLQQRLFSRFRITTNGGQCISCGNCSTYCEMGIDVRSYAQKGENIVRSSCVGCGICSAVCPRGVLKLENDSPSGRINSNEILLGNNIDLLDLITNNK
ncbi:4Fe-4S binding domain-containing protein [Flavobacterium segetis]|uniref:4Fe-4S binding domain-containing protein n=1 Tax=Flavobacterium segetis TaxID=271157 RepID=A0A1M5HDA1_9FLAO|nr:4Fe-4S dicluster domain-containing protein [Flavobacterium segetis]SHG13935.1 4Fe-4S binding domain-containing protein [Flavobacterium segetis]